MLKRGVWIAACIIGVIVLGGLAVLTGYALFFASEAGRDLSLRALTWPVLLILGAGACAAGLFMTPREFQEVTKIEIDEEPAQWVNDMRRERDSKNP